MPLAKILDTEKCLEIICVGVAIESGLTRDANVCEGTKETYMQTENVV